METFGRSGTAAAVAAMLSTPVAAQTQPASLQSRADQLLALLNGQDTPDALFAPGLASAMADAIEATLDDLEAAPARARSLRERIFLHFSQKAMVEGVLAGYRDAFANR